MILDKFKLDDKVAIVTGGARGLGQAMALAMAQAGADIAIVDVIDMQESVAQVENLGRRCIAIEADLAEHANAEKIVSRTRQELGSVDILLNDAGIIRRAPFVEFGEKDWDDVMDVNLKATFFLSQAAAKVFVEQKRGGKIINIASMLSYQGGILVSSYTASRSAILGITRSMANELAPLGINVNAIAPGYIEGAGNKALRDDPKRNAEILTRIPAGRWGQPSDLMGVIVFLASEASAYLHGFTIAVDGGWLAR
ncbi:MAG: 2-dehydro-3-deoxy-D-gluconate 5-dehydrogenase KduD [Sedimentisphaerales bacterium]|nr:2-dehydro-3-deoxy-D-gluconate 5-dehydrogenase KduD [Sedimentisphaerales bacterium]